jgi:hypothetical protein
LDSPFDRVNAIYAFEVIITIAIPVVKTILGFVCAGKATTPQAEKVENRKLKVKN